MAELERAEGKKRGNFSSRKINTDTWKQEGQQTDQASGLMELWVPGACQAPKASSPNPSRCPIILSATLPISQGGKLILTCNTTSKPATAENLWITREKSF